MIQEAKPALPRARAGLVIASLACRGFRLAHSHGELRRLLRKLGWSWLCAYEHWPRIIAPLQRRTGRILTDDGPNTRLAIRADEFDPCRERFGATGLARRVLANPNVRLVSKEAWKAASATVAVVNIASPFGGRRMRKIPRTPAIPGSAKKSWPHPSWIGTRDVGNKSANRTIDRHSIETANKRTAHEIGLVKHPPAEVRKYAP